MPQDANATVIAAAFTANSQLSGAIELNGEVICGISFPAAVVGTSITFAVGTAGGYVPLYNDDGTEVIITVVESGYVSIYPYSFIGINRLKVRSGTAASPTTETSAITVYIHTRALDG